jgi:hypothetical protein
MTVIAQSSMKTSRMRPPVEMGLSRLEETVKSWVLVQNRGLPNVLISCFVGVSLQKEHQGSADQVDADSRHGDYRETLAQATVGGRAASSEVVDLSSGRCHQARDHSSESSTASQPWVNEVGDAGDRIASPARGRDYAAAAIGVPWQCFHLRPLPQVHGSLRPRSASREAYQRPISDGARPARSRPHMIRIGSST